MPARAVRSRAQGRPDAGESPQEPAPHGLAWSGLDVGSPFDHPRRGILYVAKHLPPPGRDGLPPAYLTELSELITAAGGRTLGLFSSMRAARQAALELRGSLSVPLFCQGDDSTGQLVRQFAEDETSCLFGTLSLWQGVDVPGPALQLVVIDRIPFPRPDDPLASARQRMVGARGGNGFMAVAVSACGAAARPGGRAVAAHHGRPGHGGHPRSAAGHRAVRRFPACVAAAVLGHHRPGGGPGRAAPAGRAELLTPSRPKPGPLGLALPSRPQPATDFRQT